MRISDWSSDVCSSDLRYVGKPESEWLQLFKRKASGAMMDMIRTDLALLGISHDLYSSEAELQASGAIEAAVAQLRADGLVYEGVLEAPKRSEEHTSELQSLMRISYAVFCLKKKNKQLIKYRTTTTQ